MPAGVSTCRARAVGDRQVEVADEGGDARLVAVGLVGLEHRELGAVGGVDALVAEDAADLVDPVDPADDGLLEVELEGDAQRHVLVEGIHVRAEGTRRRAAVDELQHRGLDLDVALRVERSRIARVIAARGRTMSRASWRTRGRRSAAAPGTPRRGACAASAAGAAPCWPSARTWRGPTARLGGWR